MICGLALFLYGMHVMGEGLSRMSGGKLESILERLTQSRIRAVLLGAAVTAVIQSSSATTVMVVGFVNSGIMRLSQAAGIMIGKMLGSREYEAAYQASKKLILDGAVGAVALSAVILLLSPVYVVIYQVEPDVKRLTVQILFAYALIAPVKVLNMILGGGIIRSGGKTKYVMVIDMIGTWGFGVPLGLLAAFVLKLTIPFVYFILSLEECIRFGISLVVFRRRTWMQSLEAAEAGPATEPPSDSVL